MTEIAHTYLAWGLCRKYQPHVWVVWCNSLGNWKAASSGINEEQQSRCGWCRLQCKEFSRLAPVTQPNYIFNLNVLMAHRMLCLVLQEPCLNCTGVFWNLGAKHPILTRDLGMLAVSRNWASQIRKVNYGIMACKEKQIRPEKWRSCIFITECIVIKFLDEVSFWGATDFKYGEKYTYRNTRRRSTLICWIVYSSLSTYKFAKSVFSYLWKNNTH